MRDDRRSRTAEAAAAARALHWIEDDPVVFADPFALELTSVGWRRVLRSRTLRWLAKRLVFGPLRPVNAQVLGRSRYAEDRLEAAVAAGVGQYVIVGAGLDSFALRRRDLAERLTVFELDHPASQQAKRERIARLGLEQPKNLELVAADFEQETVGAALARSSFEPSRLAFFAWLGTVVYLTPEAVFRTLGSIAGHAAAGSELVLDYVIPREQIAQRDRRVALKVQRFMKRRNEPPLSSFDPYTFPDQVHRLGYETVENVSPREQRERYFSGRTDGLSPIGVTYLGHFRVTR